MKENLAKVMSETGSWSDDKAGITDTITVILRRLPK